MKKLLAIVLSLSLVFTMAVPSFAGAGDPQYVPAPTKVIGQSGEAYNYLALGDSMTNGYGLPGYNNENDGFDQAPEYCYPVLFAKYLSEKLGQKVNLYQYAFTALRAEDVTALLFNDDEQDNPNYVAPDAYNDIHIKSFRIDELSGENFAGKSGDQKLAQLKKDYQGAVKAADFISVCLGMNTFVCELEERVSAWALNQDPQQIGIAGNTPYYSGIIAPTAGRGAMKLENVLTVKQKEIYDSAKTQVRNLIDKVLGEGHGDNPKVEGIFDDMLYMLASFLVGYDKLADRMYELNPDATVAFIGFPNGLRDMKAKISVNGNDIVLPLDDIVGIIFGAANAYIRLQSLTYKGDAFYVDYLDCDQISKEMAACKDHEVLQINDAKNEFTEYPEFAFLEGITSNPFKSICEGLAAQLKEAMGEFGANLETGFTAENVVRGVEYIQKADKSGIEGNAVYALVGQIYLGMRAQLLNVMNNKEKYWAIDLMDAIACITDNSKLADIIAANMPDNETMGAALSTITTDQALAGIIRDMLNQEEPGALTSIEYFYANLIMGSGYGAHTSVTGHQQETEKIAAAYEEFLVKKAKKEEIETIIKKAVPVVVGGAVVTYITVKSVDFILNNSGTINTVADTPLKAVFFSAVEYARTMLNKIVDRINTVKGNLALFF